MNRPCATADYGTNGDGSKPTRPAQYPASSDTVHVTVFGFHNHTAQLWKTIHPDGREDRQQFDPALRLVATIDNFQDGTPSAATPDEDVTVHRTYTVDGNLSTLKAWTDYNQQQITNYVYGTDVGGVTPEIYRNDLLRAKIYPDSDDTTSLGDGTDGVYDRVEYAYNRQSEVIQKKDQKGSNECLGRPTTSEVWTPPSETA